MSAWAYRLSARYARECHARRRVLYRFVRDVHDDVRMAIPGGCLRARAHAAQRRTVAAMNENHANLCPTPEWAEFMQSEILPWVTENVDLGEEMLEVGPGPGATTDWLRHRVKRLV